MLGATIVFIGAAILASSYTIAQLIVGRIVAGLGTGINLSTAPTFLSECTPANARDGLLTTQSTVYLIQIITFVLHRSPGSTHQSSQPGVYDRKYQP